MATPRMMILLTRLMDLSSDLSTQLSSLVRHINQPSTCLELHPAPYNIVDKKQEALRHKKAWKIQLKEILDEAIDADPL